MNYPESLSQSVRLTAEAILAESAKLTTQVVPDAPIERDANGAWVDFEMLVPWSIHYDGQEAGSVRVAQFAREAIASPHRHQVRTKAGAQVIDLQGARRMTFQLYVPIKMSVQAE
jgi:hypothetical protein